MEIKYFKNRFQNRMFIKLKIMYEKEFLFENIFEHFESLILIKCLF